MYIQYTMDQLCLPMDLEEDIPQNHLVRFVNAAVNRLDDAIFDVDYPGGGLDSYHPKMLAKVIIYAYTSACTLPAKLQKLFAKNRVSPLPEYKLSCEGCPLKPQCTKAEGNREVKVSMNYLRLKNQAREKLRSEKGYSLAVIEPEPVFGDMKNNRGFKRFLLQCLPKVSLEVGWLSLAYNLLKKAAMDAKNKRVKLIQAA